MAFTKVVGAGIHTLSNITSHNINSSGIITATKFVGPFDGSSGTFSGNITAVDATFTGNVSIAKTLTYEDVTNVDSVGIITARQGIFIDDSITHIGDPNTKIRFPDGDTISFETAGSERLRIADDGRIGINDPTPNDYELDILKRSTATDAQIRLYNNATGSSNDTVMRYQIGGTSASNYIYFGDGDDTNVGQIRYQHSNNSMQFFTAAGERVRIVSDGKVGIGTNSPSGMLDISAANTTDMLMFKNGATNFARLGYNSASGTPILDVRSEGHVRFLTNGNNERFRIASNGDIKIGSGAPGIAVGGGLEIDTGSAATIRLEDSGSTSSFEIQNSSSVITQNMYNNQPWTIAYAGSEKLRITSGGKVGINSTAPTNMLDVVGTADVLGIYRNDYTGTGGAGLNLNFGGAKANGDLFNCAKITAVRGDNTAQAGEFRFSVLQGGTMDEKVRIKSTGYVGINTTGLYPLDVLEPTNNAGLISITGANTGYDTGFLIRNGSNAKWYLINDVNGSGGHTFEIRGDGWSNDRFFTLTQAGSVGIGSAIPGGVLDLYHATSNTILNVKSGDSGSVINLIDNATRSSIEQNGTSLKVISDTVGTYANSDIRLQVDGGTVMMLDHDGYVGINQTSPTAELEVTPKGTATDTATIFINAKNHDTNVASEAILKFGYGHSGSPDGVGHIKMVEDATNSFDADLKIALPVNNGSGGSVTTERMHLDGTYGRLGLNTTSFSDTATALSLRNGRSDSDHTMLDIICNDNQTCRLTFSEDSNNAKGSIRYYFTSDDNSMRFYTNGNSNGNERLRIDNQGKLIMGSGGATNDTSERFLVDGSGSSDHCGLGIKTNNNVHDGIIAFHDSDATYRGQIRYDHEHDDMYFTTNGGNERLRIDSGGNIGVGNWGTATIPQALSIKGGVYMQQGNVITWNNGDCDIGGISGYHLRFRTYTGSSMTEKMRITSKGIIWTPIGPNSHNSTTAAALVNTSGRQVDTSATQFQTSYKQNLSTGWYTIAVSNGGRSFGRMGISETYSSRHQACMFYAGHHYGGSSDQNSIHAVTAGRHSGNPLGALRIKAYSTYDGAMLQVYIRDDSNGVRAFLLGDNMQTHGWIMKDWIADGTDPGDLSNWSNIDTHGGIAAYADLDVIQAGGSATDGHVIPGFDNRSDLGHSSYRWDDVYATNGTIQTSDERLKQDIESLTTAEMNAAKRMSALFKTYRWKNRVSEKGDKARTHTGVIAQQVKAALEAEGLDYTKYGFIGFNEWYEDSEGTQLPSKTATRQGDPVPVDTNAELGGNIVVPPGFEKKNVYSIRTDELLAFIAAYNEQRFTSIESRLTALESS